ncbi:MULTISPECIES: hypothetical protein [Roseomonadaceae]|uniref:Primase C-terminal 2 domain-containing protein n=1 Tax=Falsiroseomonas oleicola TaxID=2801474 RepID=A0ABS6HA89_9PROT|nr:hypothetical protein [Roseomonas oleicola]MBU8544406.1 hypothetical protein [Roseomonas oleicola]
MDDQGDSQDYQDLAPRPTRAAAGTDVRHYRVTFGSGDSQTAPWSDVRSFTWPELCDRLTQHEIGAKEGNCIVPAVFRAGRRQKLDAERIEIAMLDSDAGATLEQIATAVRGQGWAAAISSTHSHLGTRTIAKRGNWDKFRAAHPNLSNPAQAFLEAERSYRPGIADGARVVAETDDQVTFDHAPCPKFRITLPLHRPWIASSYDSQATANRAWKERVTALAQALALQHDQSCTDTSRLFYLPRRPADGPPSEILVLEGQPCDLFSLPSPATAPRASVQGKRQGRAARATTDASGPFGLDFGRITFTDPDTGEILDLTAWAAASARHFEIVAALRARSPHILLGKVADGTKHHICCPNEAAHTQAGADAATFIVNASQSESRGFVIHCRHAHCDGRDRLLFLRQMLEQGWLKIEDLQTPEFLQSQPAERPLIRISGGALPEVVQQAQEALLAKPHRVYQRGSFLVRPGVIRLGVGHDPHRSHLQILEIEDQALAEVLTAAACWERVDRRKDEWVSIDAPLRVATILRQRRGHWRLPVLAGILSAPTLRADGTVLDQPGYDATTGLLLDFRGSQFPDVPDRPSKEDARAALGLLLRLISTFPFVDEASRSVALSAILSSVIRRALRTAPLHGFSAPVAGSGKSMLVDLCSVIATGRVAAVISQGKTEEEFEKRLGSLLLEGEQFIAIDNCEAPLGGEFLCSLLTQETVRCRILGRSEAPQLPSNSFVTATGNNLVMLGDMTRRALLCQLDPQVERPELRQFDCDPLAEAQANRCQLLVAALTVLRAYHVAGRPGSPPPLGSFEAWSDWVRGALLWLDQADPVATLDVVRAQDPRLDAITALLSQWHEYLGTRDVTVREIIECATAGPSSAGSSFGHQRQHFERADFREALLVIAGDNGAINSKRLGRWIGDHQGRVVNGLRITRARLLAGSQRWKLNVEAKHADAA